MSIYSHFSRINLTDDQNSVLNSLNDFLEGDSQVFVLKGYAGTGKTTLIKGVASYLNATNKQFEVMAPTGRAAKVLRDKTGYGKTIHSSIYNFADIQSINSESKELADHSLKYFFPIDLTTTYERILIVDEASMISNKESKNELFDFGTNILLDDLITYTFSTNKNNKIIFVGDPAQLPPVGDNNSYALEIDFFKEKGYKCDTGELTEVKRQEDNLILKNATTIREVYNSTTRSTLEFEYDNNSFSKLPNMDVINEYVKLYPNPNVGDGVIISFSNAQCYHYNYGIREALYPGQKEILPGDLIIINNNNYHTYKTELYNGDIAMVIDVSKSIEKLSAPVWVSVGDNREQQNIELTFRKIVIRVPHFDEEISCYIMESLLNSIDRDLSVEMMKALYINFVMRFNEEQDRREQQGFKKHKVGSEEFKLALKGDPYYNALKIKYGYAITCHKAQGGEWDMVFVDYSGRIGLHNEALRWSYTATTRAVSKVFAVNPPYFTHFDKLKISPVVYVQNIPDSALALNQILLSPFHKKNDNKGKSLKFWDIKKKLEQTSFSISNVESIGYLERYTIVDTSGNQYILQASHRESGHFIDPFRVLNGVEDENVKILEVIFNSALETPLPMDYKPSQKHLEMLYSIMREECDILNIQITNVDEKVDKYYVLYHLVTDAVYASIQFYFNGKGCFSSAVPRTFQVDNDNKLQLLIQKLSNYAG